MVLYGFLKDFLHGSCTAWRVDDTSLGDGEDAVFADAVVEILGDMGGEGCGRFMPIQPCRYTEAYGMFLWVFLHHLQSGV